jgi:uncharacterized membrane protein
MAGSDLDLLDPDEFFADYDRRARERRERRTRAPRRRLRIRRDARPAKQGARGAPAGRDRTGAAADPHGLRGSAAGRALLAAVGLLALMTVVGLLALWPTGTIHHSGSGVGPTVAANVLSQTTVSCGSPPSVSCRQIEVSVNGRRSPITLGPVATTPALGAGTPILVSPVALPRGQSAPPGYQPWQFVDVDRHGSLLWLGGALLALALIVIRLRGLLAAVGVGLSLVLVSVFLVPAILDGESALLVALVCALAVMFVTLLLTSGFGAQTMAAALGIGGTLLLTAVLALFAVHLAHLDGRTDELSAYLGSENPNLSLQGIVLAGMVVGALGVLADIGVTQASAVMALRRADPALGPRALYREAFLVGRDHLSATIHTLVLAYVGASLPLLLISRSTGVGFADAISSQDLAEPIVAALVGCIGLVCAVPLTTGLASLLVARVPAQALPDGHAHHHH